MSRYDHYLLTDLPDSEDEADVAAALQARLRMPADLAALLAAHYVHDVAHPAVESLIEDAIDADRRDQPGDLLR
jgi:hypothetical protein